MKSMPAEMNDLEARKLENAIDLAGRALLAAPTQEAQRACLEAYMDLVKMRPPQTVRRMEIERGLA
jgi:hypothetical protein